MLVKGGWIIAVPVRGGLRLGIGDCGLAIGGGSMVLLGLGRERAERVGYVDVFEGVDR